MVALTLGPALVQMGKPAVLISTTQLVVAVALPPTVTATLLATQVRDFLAVLVVAVP